MLIRHLLGTRGRRCKRCLIPQLEPSGVTRVLLEAQVLVDERGLFEALVPFVTDTR